MAQAISLATRPHVVIATPGRLADHIRSSGEDTICGLRRVKFVVFDEADRLLTDSFAEDLEECLSVVPSPAERQSLLFTATVTDEIRLLQERPVATGRPPKFICEIDTNQYTFPILSAIPRTRANSSRQSLNSPHTLTTIPTHAITGPGSLSTYITQYTTQ